MATTAIQQSDKFYWHGYIQFYESHIRDLPVKSIVEMGVLRGNSIRWLIERFPQAKIYGLDILDVQPEWPVDARVTYQNVDQSDRNQLKAFFIGKQFDLVIEDGSHLPAHQVNSLVEGFGSVTPGGIYILEDIQTSLPVHDYFKSTGMESAGVLKGTALTCLLAIEHIKRIGGALDDRAASLIAQNSLFTKTEVMELFRSIDSLFLYRRPHLPDRCYRCGSSEYNYNAYKCTCGVNIFEEADSMSFLIRKAR